MTNRNSWPHLSAFGAWAIAFGCAVGWDVLVLPLTEFLPKAGPAGALIGLACGALAMAVIAWNFHFMIGKCPGPGGVYSYAKKAFGHDHGYICAWFLCLAYAAIVWADAQMLTVVVRYLIGGDPLHFGFKYHVAGFRVCLGDIVIVATAMAAVVALTVRRRIAAAVQSVLAVALAVGLVVYFCAAAFGHVGGVASMHPFFSPKGGSPISQILGVLMITPWLFVGIESISSMSAEFNFPVRRSFGIMAAAIVATVAAYVAALLIPVLASGGGEAGWSAAITASGDANARAFDLVKGTLGGAGTAVLGLALGGALFTNLVGNTVVASRLLAAMADDGAMPHWLGRKDGALSARNAIFVIALIAVATSALGQTVIEVIVDIAIVGTAVAYAYTSGATFKLARAEGDRVSAATGLVGLVFSAAIAFLFLLPVFSATMGTVSYLVLVLWCIAGLVFFLLIFRREGSRRFGRSSVVWVSLFLVILALSHLWTRQMAGEAMRDAYEDIAESHDSACRRNSPDGAPSTCGMSWKEDLRRDLGVVRSTIIRNSVVQSGLNVLAIALMIAVYVILRRRELDMEREKAKAKSFFFSTVSHDIRTPLNAIIGFSEMLKSGFSTEEERVQAVDSIIASGKTLLGLVNDVLDLSKLESGKMEILPEPTDCAKLLREVADAFRVASAKSGVEVRCRADAMPALMLDPQRLRQIAFNLVGNAVKFTQKGFVEVRASFSEGTLSLAVEDTGCGISEEDLGRIGSAYVQVGSSMSRNGGTGLGLAICRQLATAMGGRIDVVSKLGKGSTFTVTIPGVKVVESGEVKSGGVKSGGVEELTHPLTHSPTHPLNNSPTCLRILIVDDSKMNIMVLKAQLKNLGQFEVAAAGDGQEALELLRSKGANSFDLVLTDMWMPRMDGEDLVKAIRADPLLSGLRVVVVTADVEFRAKFDAVGFDDILLKPVTRDGLAEMLAKEGR